MLRTVLPLLDGRSESAWESVLRLLHVTADVEVEPQREIRTAAGAFVARADLWLVGTRRLHEYDGADHRDVETHRADLARDRRLVDERWERCGYTSREVLRRGGEIIAAADTALGRAWHPGRLAAWRALVSRSLLRQRRAPAAARALVRDEPLTTAARRAALSRSRAQRFLAAGWGARRGVRG